MAVFKKVLSVVFLLASLAIMLFGYLVISVLIDFLLPSFFNVARIIFPAVLVISAIWIFVKAFDIKSASKKVLAAISLLILLLPCIIFGSKMYVNYNNSFFQQERWTKNPEIRVYMVDNLLQNYELKGMPRDEVKELLGEPTDTPYFKTPGNFVYYLGPERGLIRIDSEWLVIDFDNNGIVQSYMIATD